MLFVRPPDEGPDGRLCQEADNAVTAFAKAAEDIETGVPPTAEGFAAMDASTEELVKPTF